MTFNPWDIPYDDFADCVEESGGIAWQNKEWQILLSGRARSEFKRLSVRRLDLGEKAPLWHLVHKPDSFSSSPRRYGTGRIPSPQEAALLALQEGRMIRRYYADSTPNLRSQGIKSLTLFWLNANGLGGLQRKNPAYKYIGNTSAQTFFSWPSLQQTIAEEEDSLRWWHILKEDMANSASDACFALNFDALSFAEKSDRVWTWKNGGYEMVRKVLELALLSQHELWQKDSVWRWDIQLPLRQDEQRYGFMRSVQSPQRKPNSLPTLQHAAELANDYFAPTRDERLMRTSYCVQRWHQLCTLMNFDIYCDAPTMHERMEASLLWQEWQTRMQ